MRSLLALLTAACIGLALTPTAASARPFGGGFRGGGFHGGFHGGFRGGRGFGFAPFVGAAVGLGIAGATYPYWGGPGYYAYGDGCLAPRRIWTPYGWRTRWVNVCY